MYCSACKTRLSPRDRTCPRCGQVVSIQDLGAPGLPTGGSSQPLPPSQSWEEELTALAPPERSKRRPPGRRLEPGTQERRRADRPPRPRRERDPSASSSGDSLGSLLRTDHVRKLVTERPEMIEGGMVLHTDGSGDPVGGRYVTAVGDIDLLGRDSGGGWVVVKVAEPGHEKELVSDMLQLIGWVRKHRAKRGEEVRGIVLLESVPESLGYAAAAVADTIEFKQYRLVLTLESVDV